MNRIIYKSELAQSMYFILMMELAKAERDFEGRGFGSVFEDPSHIWIDLKYYLGHFVQDLYINTAKAEFLQETGVMNETQYEKLCNLIQRSIINTVSIRYKKNESVLDKTTCTMDLA